MNITCVLRVDAASREEAMNAVDDNKLIKIFGDTPYELVKMDADAYISDTMFEWKLTFNSRISNNVLPLNVGVINTPVISTPVVTPEPTTSNEPLTVLDKLQNEFNTKTGHFAEDE